MSLPHKTAGCSTATCDLMRKPYESWQDRGKGTMASNAGVIYTV